MQTRLNPDTPEDYCGTTYAAKLLGLSVGTIQTLVEKNELQAWKTQGGHRRISMPSIRDYQKKHNMLLNPLETKENRLRVLLVEDDPVTRDMIRDFCNRCDMPVDSTAMSSGLEALIDMASIQPDVLIAD
jgi:excisionase family DNA binding protein